MYIFDLDEACSVKDVVAESLKNLGVRCRLPKKMKENEKENIYFPEYQIFQKPLHLLKFCTVTRLNGASIEVPEFLADACAVIERDIKTEGIFRRAGSTSKQRESKSLIDKGKKLNYEYHVFDACGLVKLFFRELPQPLIPYSYQEIISGCLLLSSQQRQVEALMLACLLLPSENLKTLAFFMEFLFKVSKYSHANKMSRKNLAIILTPTLMPANKGRSNNLDMAHHFKVLELLMENCERIGVIPDNVEDSLANEKRKKKKRSGSLTRMFTGLKRIVGNRASNATDWDESGLSTPGSVGSLGKRKSSESSTVSGILSKKKRVVDALPDGALLATPLRCRMHGYVAPVYTSEGSVVPQNLKKAKPADASAKPRRRRTDDNDDEDTRSSGSSIVRKCLTRKQKAMGKTESSSSIGSLFSLGGRKTSLDRRSSAITTWSRKKSLNHLFLNKSDGSDDGLSAARSATDDSELITVHKSEYEDIKNRVLALEEELESLSSAHSVQSAYEKTLEESEKIGGVAAAAAAATTEQLARRMSRELRIRRSLDGNPIRSPSARKIGSIRRRSKESLHRSAEHKTALKRGRPNTVQSGLPSPGGRRFPSGDEKHDSALAAAAAAAATPVQGHQTEWQSGEEFFAREYLLQKLLPTQQQGRPSIVEIRNHNAGMVLEKAKLFNALNQADAGAREIKAAANVQKRQSVRIESLRRLRETCDSPNRPVTRSTSLGATESNEIFYVREREARNGGIWRRPFNETPPPPPRHAVNGSQSSPCEIPTPLIKKCLNTPRSPRHFAKTPTAQFKSSARNRATPAARLAIDPYGTPRVGVRRSPRILARSLTSSPRPNDQ